MSCVYTHTHTHTQVYFLISTFLHLDLREKQLMITMGLIKDYIFHLVVFVLLSVKEINGWSCSQPVGKVFSLPQTDALLQFDISCCLPSSGGSRTFSLKFHDGTDLGSVTYYQGTAYPNPGEGVTITADSVGRVDVTLKGVSTANAGIYAITAVSAVETKCVCLYILGVPSKQTISVNRNPEVGESAILTCSSTSTTTPSNHSLSLVYNWKVDGAVNPGDYTYSANRKTLTVSNVKLTDGSKQFTCSAKEDVSDGPPSLDSNPYSLNILYGPDNIILTPSALTYEKVENSSLSPITCSASCNPTCSFKWYNVDTRTYVSDNNVLNLGKLTSSDAATYRCIATRASDKTRTQDLLVNVIYGPRNMNFNPDKTVYRENVNFNLPTISCSSECWDCQYSWTGPNSHDSPTATLDLNNLQRSMAGSYSCTARNIKTSSQNQLSREVKIEVRYGPDSVSVSPGNKTYTIDEGSMLYNIDCLADCFPTCNFRWTKEGQQNAVSTNRTLPLGIIQKSYSGKYTCTATNGDVSTWVTQTNVVINVRYGPYATSTSISPPTEEYVRNEGTYMPDITCNADCFPFCTYTWTKQKDGKTSTVSSTGVLSLGNLNREHVATYICTAKNPGKTVSPETRKHITVNVRYGPDTLDVSEQSPYSVKEGDAVPNITCSATCYPGCTYKWTNVTDRLDISSNNILAFGTMNRYMTGQYKCESSNTASQYTKSSETTITVTVKYAPDVSVHLSTETLVEGSDLTLSCIGSGEPAVYNYVSLKQTTDSIEIPNDNKAMSGTQQYSSIHFSPLKFQDTGTYTCTLNNGISNILGILNQSGSRQLNVQAKPKVLSSELRFTGATGGIANIQLEMYSYPDLKTMSIRRYDGTVIKPDNKYNITAIDGDVMTTFYGEHVSLRGSVVHFAIHDLEVDDFGNYTLILTNDIDRTSNILFLIAQGKPSPPKVFVHLPEKSVPTFIWQKSFNGGPIQSFVIQISSAGAEMWRNFTNILESDARYKINDTFYTANISGLSPGLYNARIFANNSIGDSDTVDLGQEIEMKAEKGEEEEGESLPLGAIVGGISGALILFGLVIVIVIVLKRRAEHKDESRKKLDTRKFNSEEDDDEDEVNTVNPMYVSADDVQPTDGTYAQPIKKKKNIDENKDVYAMVNKAAKKGKEEIVIYKNAPSLGEASKGKHPKGRAKQEKGKDKEENGKDIEENVLKNTKSDTTKQQKKLVNKDGLIYADLTFNDQPKGQKKLVIHGLDSMTEYVEVDFTKRADPLPDSDEEGSGKTT